MTAQRQMILRVSPAGVKSIDMIGCDGNECATISQPIEIALGGIVGSRQTKPEFDFPVEDSGVARVRDSF